MRDLQDLVGSWVLSRRIDDDSLGGVYFEGDATFHPSGNDLIYREEGVLHLPGRSLRATRGYLWSGFPLIRVRFDDGRLFHELDAREMQPRASHLCGEDLYEVSYDFRRWPVWHAVWKVEGPRKSYVATTSHAPLGACTDGAGKAEPLKAHGTE